MSIRRDPIYISSDVWRWLRMLAKAEQADYAGQINVQITPDLVADQILRQAIREQHPTLSEGQKELDKLEKKIIESLRNHENKAVSGTLGEGAES